MCISCREMKEKRELVRMVKAPDSIVHIDDTKGKAAGRGAYICHNSTCIDKAIKSKAFERAFGQKIDSEIYAILKDEVASRKSVIQQKDLKGETDR